VWLNANRYDRTRGTAENWILTIARRRAVDRVRHVSAAERRDDAHAETEPVSLPDSTADLAVALEEARLVREALGRLPGAQRQAIELAYLGGQTHREIAVLLGIPVGTGKTRIRDGLRRLRLELQASGIRAEPMTATTAQTPVRSPA
jgi:RNA polymerase sigma-70 factor (ECF subfamily)